MKLEKTKQKQKKLAQPLLSALIAAILLIGGAIANVVAAKLTLMPGGLVWAIFGAIIVLVIIFTFILGLAQHNQEKQEEKNEKLTQLPINNSQPHEATIQERVQFYLKSMEPKWRTLDLTGLAGGNGGNLEIPLEDVYISLQAEKGSIKERVSERRLLERETFAYMQKIGLIDHSNNEVAEDVKRKAIIEEYNYYERRIASNLEKRDIELEEAVLKNNSMVILGNPGSGKSTLFKYLALQNARALLNRQEFVTYGNNIHSTQEQASLSAITSSEQRGSALCPARLPVFIRIANYAEKLSKNQDTSLLDFIGEHLHGHWQVDLSEKELLELVKYYIGQKKTLLLLDGLDEVSDNLRPKVTEKIKDFIQKVIGADGSNRSPDNTEAVQGNQVIITSRIVGYQLAPVQVKVQYRIQEMNDQKISLFLEQLCFTVERVAWETEHERPMEAAEKTQVKQSSDLQVKRLKQAIEEENSYIRSLAVNPLLLSMLILVQREKADIPRLRFELYQKSVSTLLSTWRKNELLMTEEEFIKALGPLATWLHLTQLTGLATKQQLYDQLYLGLYPDKPYSPHDQRVWNIIQQVRQTSGIIVEKGEGVYGFIHRTFQEYIIACELCEKARYEQFTKHILENLYNVRWNVPLLLAVGGLAQKYPDLLEKNLSIILSRVDQNDPLQRGLLFVAEAFLECDNVPPKLIREVTERLIEIYDDPDLGAKFAPLATQIEALLKRWHQASWSPIVDTHLCQVLLKAKSEKQAIIARLVEKAEWSTTELMRKIRTVERRASGLTLFTLGQAYQSLAKRQPKSIPTEGLELRRWCQIYPRFWELIVGCRPLTVLVYYLCELVGDLKPENISRETPVLTTLLQKELNPLLKTDQTDTATMEALVARLSDAFRQMLERDDMPESDWAPAAVALLHIEGEKELDFVLQRLAQINSSSLVERFLIIRALNRNFDRELDTQIAHSLMRSSTHTLGSVPQTTITPVPDLTSALKFDLDLDLDLDLDFAHDFDLDPDLALALDQFRAFTRGLDLDLDLDLAHNLDYALALDHASSEAFNLDQARADSHVRNPALEQVFTYSRSRAFALARSWGQIVSQDERAQRKAYRALCEFKTLLASNEAVASLNHLWRTGWRESWLLIARLRGEQWINLNQETIAMLEGWLTDMPADKQIYPLLLLAEKNAPLPSDWPDLLAQGLYHPDDEVRERTSAVLRRERKLSEIELTLLLRLAQITIAADKEGNSLAFLSLRTTLHKIHYDDPAKLKTLCEQAEQDEQPRALLSLFILSELHRVEDNSIEVFYHYLYEGSAAIKQALIYTTRWLLDNDNHHQDELESILLELLIDQSWPPQTFSLSIADALSYAPHPSEATVRTFLQYTMPTDEIQNLATLDIPYWHALARLASKAPDKEKSRILTLLEKALSEPAMRFAASAALTGYYFLQTIQENRDTVIDEQESAMKHIEKLLPSSQERLTALLAAGYSDYQWIEEYHEQLANAAAALVEQDKDLVHELIEQLRINTLGDHRQIVIATLAFLARRAPALYNLETLPEDTEELLLLSCRNAISPHMRKFGLLAISRLHRVTSQVSELLLLSCKDTDSVIQCLPEAVGQFREIELDVITELAKGLQDESARTRAAVAHLLAELVVSAVSNQNRVALQEKALPLLKDALDDHGSDTFYQYYTDNGRKHYDKLYNAFYNAFYLVRMA